MYTFDAVLVLGGGIYLDGSLAPDCRKQVEKAVELVKAGTALRCIMSGLYGYKGEEKPVISEARAYATYAKELGLRDDQLFMEERAQETLGNVLFSKMNILLPNNWTRVAVIPTMNQLSERIEYLLKKILGPGYEWEIVRVSEDLREENVAREQKSLEYTRQINDYYEDGDHEGIYEGLMATHPAYGGTKWTVEELRKELGG